MASPAQLISYLPNLFRLGMISRVLRMVLVVGVLCYQHSPTDFEHISRLMMRWES